MGNAALYAVGLIVALIGSIWWAYFSYKILEHIHATELIWFLFFGYIPIVFASAMLGKIIDWVQDQ